VKERGSGSHRASDGTRFERHGASGAPTVVLIHGLGMHRATWDQHVGRLSDAFDLITYDLVGHGESPPSVNPPSLTTFSDQLLSVLDDLSIERAAIVGFSLGGMVNRRFAIDHPERVSALAILNSPHQRGDEAQRAVEQRALESAAGGPRATIDATLERWFTPAFRESRPELVDEVKQWVLANDSDLYAQNRWVLANGVVELIDPRPEITAPTLVMTCELDSGSTPEMSHAIAEEIPGSEMIVVPGLQHLGLLEDPEAFTEPIRAFFERHLNVGNG
jgi:pimeloyl-ACP methyl ester carboxylesterase